MGVPFSKIIQNDIEYDVTQYANKIEVPYIASDTMNAVLQKIYNALNAKVDDFKTIKQAMMVNSNSHHVEIFHCMSIYSKNMTLSYLNVTATEGNFGCVTIKNQANTYFALVVNSQFNRLLDISSSNMEYDGTLTLYYS